MELYPKMKFHEIDQARYECIDPETGEINAEMWDALNDIENNKLEWLCIRIKEEKAAANAIKAEKIALGERQAAKEKLAANLEAFLAKRLDGAKFETARVAVSYRKSEQVIIDDIAEIPAEFLKWADPTADKTAIKAAMKKGDVPGAHLEQKNNIQIK